MTLSPGTFSSSGPFRDRKISDQWNVRVLKSAPDEIESSSRDVSKLAPVHVVVPHILQERQLCACASASMVLRSFGVDVAQTKIKHLSNQMRQQDGTGQLPWNLLR